MVPLVAYGAASLVASAVVLLALMAVSFIPGGMQPEMQMLPVLLGYLVVLAIVIALVFAVPATIVIRVFRRWGITSHALYAFAGALIGLISLSALLVLQGLTDAFAFWLDVKPPNDDTQSALLLLMSFVATLAGAAAGVTYRFLAGGRA